LEGASTEAGKAWAISISNARYAPNIGHEGAGLEPLDDSINEIQCDKGRKAGQQSSPRRKYLDIFSAAVPDLVDLGLAAEA
jgi:hypothetical protein